MNPVRNSKNKREKYFKTGFGRRFLRNLLENYLKFAHACDGGQVGPH